MYIVVPVIMQIPFWSIRNITMYQNIDNTSEGNLRYQAMFSNLYFYV